MNHSFYVSMPIVSMLIVSVLIGSSFLLAPSSYSAEPLAAAEVIKRNPSRPLGFSAPLHQEVSLVLKSVLISKLRKNAVINTSLVVEGGQVAGYRVLSISEDSVALEGLNGEGRRVLRSQPAAYKKNLKRIVSRQTASQHD